MIIRRLLFALSLAGALAGQTFVQISTRSSVFTKNASFEHETVNLEFAIANANRLCKRGWLNTLAKTCESKRSRDVQP